jgi:DNA replication protein DnaC
MAFSGTVPEFSMERRTSVLFELISARYEHRSVLITANQPFGEWNRVFADPAMTLVASTGSSTTRQSSR